MTARTPSASGSRARLLDALDEAARRIGAQTVLVSDLVATRVGLNSTDLECLDLLYLAGASTAGRLSEHTGLTSGAITAAIDRLERAGFVTRRRDSRDRRVVRVEVVDAGAKLIAPFYRPLHDRLEKVNTRYRRGQLSVVLRYLTDALAAMADHVTWLQTQPNVSRGRCRHPMTAMSARAAAGPRQTARSARGGARRAASPRNRP